MVFWIFLAVMLLILSGSGVKAISSSKNKNKSIKAKVDLSWPAKQILKEYNNLPPENRPFEDIVAILAALDIKHGRGKVNDHFNDGYSYYYSWTSCRCNYSTRYKNCTYKDYRDLHKEIEEVNQAIQKQQHALEMSKVAHDLEDVKTLTERLRQEKEIIASVTKELT